MPVFLIGKLTFETQLPPPDEKKGGVPFVLAALDETKQLGASTHAILYTTYGSNRSLSFGGVLTAVWSIGLKYEAATIFIVRKNLFPYETSSPDPLRSVSCLMSTDGGGS